MMEVFSSEAMLGVLLNPLFLSPCLYPFTVTQQVKCWNFSRSDLALT